MYKEYGSRDMSYAYLFKLIMVGDSGVGKSTMLYKLVNNTFRRSSDMTIGVEFGSKLIKIDDKPIKLHIWDTAGQENFRSITRSYYRDAVGVMLCYDVTNATSFNNISKWLDDIKQITDSCVIILVGTKTDEESKRVVRYKDGEKLAEKNNLLFVETSSKSADDKSVEQCFKKIADDIYNKIKNGTIDVTKNGIKLGLVTDELNKPVQRKVEPDTGCCY